MIRTAKQPVEAEAFARDSLRGYWRDIDELPHWPCTTLTALRLLGCTWPDLDELALVRLIKAKAIPARRRWNAVDVCQLGYVWQLRQELLLLHRDLPRALKNLGVDVGKEASCPSESKSV
jgi:hypothetical protein